LLFFLDLTFLGDRLREPLDEQRPLVSLSDEPDRLGSGGAATAGGDDVSLSLLSDSDRESSLSIDFERTAALRLFISFFNNFMLLFLALARSFFIFLSIFSFFCFRRFLSNFLFFFSLRFLLFFFDFFFSFAASFSSSSSSTLNVSSFWNAPFSFFLNYLLRINLVPI
jgi:hypothetical protein